MTNKEVLEKALKRAEENGWEYRPILIMRTENIETDKSSIIEPSRQHALFLDIPLLQTFAKALWGEEKPYYQHVMKDSLSIKEEELAEWQYHLQQMVISPDPIEYLRKEI